jgi:predicted nucleic-acid-binding Zn-ribbon protein
MPEERSADETEKRREELLGARADATVRWLREKWGTDPACPYCRHTSWEVGLPTQLAVWTGGAVPPVFAVTCTNCGNTVFVDAQRAGLAWTEDELKLLNARRHA